MKTRTRPRRGRRASRWHLAVAISAAAAALRLASDPLPEAASTRAAFEAQYPESGASGSALELERLAAGIGIDLAPKPKEVEAPDRSGSPLPPPDDGRARPAPESRYAHSQAAGQFLERELRVPDERIGTGSPALEQFLADQDGELTSIEAVLLGPNPPRWEMHVKLRWEAPLPNLLGQMQLGRLLVARALVEARSESTESALRTLDASWRLTEELLGRPELISALIAIALGKIQVGALRKIDAPAYGWSDRLREGRFAAACLAALQNETWLGYSQLRDLSGDGAEVGRALRRTADEIGRSSLCEWTERGLNAIWTASFAAENPTDEDRIIGTIPIPNLLNALLRARRVEVDAELTALVVDARVERAASRRRNWPARLLTAGAGVCPEQPWTYAAADNGTARVRLETALEETEAPTYHLPLEFTAGKPKPPAKRPAASSVKVRPRLL